MAESQINQAEAQPAARARGPELDLAVVLRRAADQVELAREPITASDFSDIYSELWRDGWLRRGEPRVSMEDLTYLCDPSLADGPGSRCATFLFEAIGPGGRRFQRRLSFDVFHDVAARGAQRLVAAGVLQANDLYHYEVVASPRQPRARLPQVETLKVTARHPPLRYLTVPLGPLVTRAKAVGQVDATMMPVFYTTAAVLRAEHFARQGAKARPPIETGAVLVGPLCSCPETGEFFAVVCNVFEVRDAERSSFSLEYSGQTWARLQAIVRAVQGQPATRAHRIVGQAHGHPLPPGGASDCGGCPKRTTCTRTSVFVSIDDRTWSQAVFCRQPWQLAHIFGVNARGDDVQCLFGLRDNRLVARGFYVIKDFDPGKEAIAEAETV